VLPRTFTISVLNGESRKRPEYAQADSGHLAPAPTAFTNRLSDKNL